MAKSEATQAIGELAFTPRFARDDYLWNQIRRAAGSVIHNIAEGFDSGSGAEFVRFLKMARRSASKVQSELYQTLDRKHISEEECCRSHQIASESKRRINELIAYLRKRTN